MSESAEWLRNLARNYADGVAGMTPQDHPAWDIADEIERLRALLYRCQVAWVEDDSDLAAEVRAALEGK